MYVCTCVCVGSPGPPGLNGSDGDPGPKGPAGDDGKSLMWDSYPFFQHGLIMSSPLYFTYNVVKLPTRVCALVSEVTIVSMLIYICALTNCVFYMYNCFQ